MQQQEVSVPLCTAGEEKLAGEPGGRKGWSRRQAERAAEMPPAKHNTRKEEEKKRQNNTVKRKEPTEMKRLVRCRLGRRGKFNEQVDSNEVYKSRSKPNQNEIRITQKHNLNL